MSRFLLAFVLLVAVLEEGLCHEFKFHDGNIPEFPEGGLVIYAQGSGCQLGKYGDGMQSLVRWVTRGLFTNIITRQVTGGTSLHFHYYDSSGEITRRLQMWSKTPIHEPEKALEWVISKSYTPFTPQVRVFREPGVANWGGHDYELHLGNYPYFIANYYAKQRVNEKGETGYLLTITSPEEQTFVTSFLEEQHEEFLESEKVRLRENYARLDALAKEKEPAEQEEEEEPRINPDEINLRKSSVWLGARDHRFEGLWEWEGGEYEGEVFYAVGGFDDEEEDDEEETPVPTYSNWQRPPKIQKFRNCASVWDIWRNRGCDTNHAFVVEFGGKSSITDSNQKEEL